MAEYKAKAQQEISPNQDILFTNTTICSNNSIIHKNGSGSIILKGCTHQYRARYRISFSADAAIIRDTDEPIHLIMEVDGNTLSGGDMIVTPAAANEYFNLSKYIYVDVPARHCVYFNIKNSGNKKIKVQNVNLIIERVA